MPVSDLSPCAGILHVPPWTSDLRMLGPWSWGSHRAGTATCRAAACGRCWPCWRSTAAGSCALDRILDELWGAGGRSGSTTRCTSSRRGCARRRRPASRLARRRLRARLPAEAIDADRFEALLGRAARSSRAASRPRPARRCATPWRSGAAPRWPTSTTRRSPAEEASRLEALRLDCLRERLAADLACGLHADVARRARGAGRRAAARRGPARCADARALPLGPAGGGPRGLPRRAAPRCATGSGWSRRPSCARWSGRSCATRWPCCGRRRPRAAPPDARRRVTCAFAAAADGPRDAARRARPRGARRRPRRARTRPRRGLRRPRRHGRSSGASTACWRSSAAPSPTRTTPCARCARRRRRARPRRGAAGWRAGAGRRGDGRRRPSHARGGRPRRSARRDGAERAGPRRGAGRIRLAAGDVAARAARGDRAPRLGDAVALGDSSRRDADRPPARRAARRARRPSCEQLGGGLRARRRGAPRASCDRRRRGRGSARRGSSHELGRRAGDPGTRPARPCRGLRRRR